MDASHVVEVVELLRKINGIVNRLHEVSDCFPNDANRKEFRRHLDDILEMVNANILIVWAVVQQDRRERGMAEFDLQKILLEVSDALERDPSLQSFYRCN